MSYISFSMLRNSVSFFFVFLLVQILLAVVWRIVFVNIDGEQQQNHNNYIYTHTQHQQYNNKIIFIDIVFNFV